MASLVRLCALLAAGFVAVSFLCFATVELNDSSEDTVRALDGSPAAERLAGEVLRPNPAAEVESVREANHGTVREAIDDVDDVLLSPFTGATGFESVWGERFAALVIGLLVWGVGGLMLANSLPKHRRKARDWREATP